MRDFRKPDGAGTLERPRMRLEYASNLLASGTESTEPERMISPIVSSGDRLEREAVAKQAGPKKRTNNIGNAIAKRSQR